MTDTIELPLTGRCMCGAARFEVTRPPMGALYCHCTRCQRRTGTAASANALMEPGSFRITAGEDHLRSWHPPDDGWVKSFCELCGSHIHTTDPGRPEMQSVRLGALDGDPGIRPRAHQFTGEAVSWEPIPDDGLPRYDDRPPPS